MNIFCTLCKAQYLKFLGCTKLLLEQGKFVVAKRLKELDFAESITETPADGSCMFWALLDQIQSNPVLKNYAESHWELRWKVVSEGYETFLKTGVLSWPDDPMTGSLKEWKTKMLNPTEYGDEKENINDVQVFIADDK